ncbi:MAG: efflux RND transporter periplasmic adaptor subunit [Acidobacteria bacterium]|nr:efflux RND transporter periplasmic adaptor subunit [Acidobacteriota bacterium]
MKTKTKITLSIIGLIIFSFLLMFFLRGLKPEQEKMVHPEFKRKVKVAPVLYENVKAEVTSLGRVLSTHEVTLSAEVQGKLIEGDIPFKKGQSFKKGDLLVKIYDKQMRLTLNSSKSSFLNSVALLLPDFKIDFPENFEAWNQFFNSIDIDKDLPPMPKIKSNKEKIFLASRGILSSYYSIKQQEETLEKYNLIAPFDGALTDVRLQGGSVANIGSTLATMIRTDSLEIEFPLELEDASWVKIGDKVTICLEDGSKTWEGITVRKSNFVDPQTQSISAFVNVDNKNGTPLYKGQYLKASFNGRVIKETMEIPRNAVFNHNIVFIVNDNRLKKQEIKIHKINSNTIIFSGIDKGTLVVVEPLLNVAENSLVETLEDEENNN